MPEVPQVGEIVLCCGLGAVAIPHHCRQFPTGHDERRYGLSVTLESSLAVDQRLFEVSLPSRCDAQRDAGFCVAHRGSLGSVEVRTGPEHFFCQRPGQLVLPRKSR